MWRAWLLRRTRIRIFRRATAPRPLAVCGVHGAELPHRRGVKKILDNRAIRVCAIAVAFSLAACASSRNRSATTSKTSAPAVTKPALDTSAPAKHEQASAEKDLAKLLVSISDVPNGFTVRPPGLSEDSETQVCDADAFPPEAKRTARAGISFTKAQVVLSEKLTSYTSANEAESVLANARSAYQQCKAFDRTDDHGAVAHYTVAALSFDRVAEDQVAFRVTFAANTYSGTGDFVAARADSLIMVAAWLSVSPTPGPTQLDSHDFASFTKIAYQRIT